MKYARILLGAVVWLAASWLLWKGVLEPRTVASAGKSSPAQDLLDFAVGKTSTAPLATEEALDIAVGDPIFVVEGDRVRRIGEIRSVRDRETGVLARRADATAAEAIFYPSAPALSADAHLDYYDSGRTMDWVLETMLPAEKRAEVAGLIKDAYQQHHEEILTALLPVVQRSLREAFVVVERDLPKSISKHHERLEAIGRKYQKDIVEEKVVPLMKTELLPIVKSRAESLCEQMGNDIYTRLSKSAILWSGTKGMFTWSAAKRSREEAVRQLKAHSGDVMVEHQDDIRTAVVGILSDIASNDQVRKVVRESVDRMIEDPELRQVVWDIAREVIIDNPALGEAIAKSWTSPEAKAALNLAVSRIEPTVNQIGHVLFGTREGGFTPEFARVLRAKILRKDRRWFVLVQKTSAPANGAGKPPAALPVAQGEIAALDPFLNAVAVNDTARNDSAAGP